MGTAAAKTGFRVHAGVVFSLLLAIALARIVSTYGVFSHTNDEPAHIACGMEWLDRETYTYDYQHPPLARVATAIGPYLSGARSIGKPYMWQEGNAILGAGAGYDRSLFLARLGVLPFFILSSVVVFAWSRDLLGDGAALAAAALFTTLPPILAHGGLATTDMALAGTFPLAMLAFLRWLDRPGLPRGIALGAAAGLAVLSKFSSVVFLLACCPAILALRRWGGRPEEEARDAAAFRPLRGAGVALIVLFVTIWAGYRFSTGAVSERGNRPHTTIDRVLGARGPIHDLAYGVAEAPVYPMPEFFRGINHLRIHNAEGHRGQFLFGEIRETSWWYFFFVALAVKTPVPFLALSAIGSFALWRRWKREGDWRLIAPILCAAAILLACVPSHIKLGIRHILPVFPFLAIAAAGGADRLWKADALRPAGTVLAAGLILWQVADGVRVHPDYLPYFNVLAGAHPERILNDSDLDWGQDVKRLVWTLRDRGVREASVALATSAELDRFAPPRMTPLRPNERATGWIAVSQYRLQYDFTRQPPFKGYSWLEAYDPVALVGKTIRLYDIASGPNGSRAGAPAGTPGGTSRP